MAHHANVFEKLSKSGSNSSISTNKQQENPIDSKMLETVKLLGKQIIEIREIIDNQNSLLEAMKNEIVSLRKKQNDTSGDVKLAMIDQKDLAKQFRTLKATVTGEQLANNRFSNTPDDIAKRFYRNYDSSQVFENAEQSNNEAHSWGAFDRNSNQNKSNNQAANLPDNELGRSMQTQNVAKEFIFGRLPKLLNLE